MHDLFVRGHVQVFCVIRAKDSSAAKSRLFATLKKRQLIENDSANWLDRCAASTFSATGAPFRQPSWHAIGVSATVVRVA